MKSWGNESGQTAAERKIEHLTIWKKHAGVEAAHIKWHQCGGRMWKITD
ncbi:hypothetical protein MUO15_09920 [Halobacillus amylolyticus]|uniref:Uncharacterized protein n=1 Tax=Halobacillus amylolyticus TaxID=2932259 RepID=A0ABY4HFN8_9BACI|nr:hypothetical protein [Halobacillus amylolyticus]UOR13721.1 hypothetical protein MUO15_09920 [Halobacillus amylolyticus]